MGINPVNSYTASGGIKQSVYDQVDYSGYKLTSQGNLYKESNSWKTYAPLVAAPLGALNAISAEAEFSTLPRQKKPISSRIFTVIYTAFISGLLWFGIGSIIDKIIDSSRAKRADELADLNSQQLHY